MKPKEPSSKHHKAALVSLVLAGVCGALHFAPLALDCPGQPIAVVAWIAALYAGASALDDAWRARRFSMSTHGKSLAYTTLAFAAISYSGFGQDPCWQESRILSCVYVTRDTLRAAMRSNESMTAKAFTQQVATSDKFLDPFGEGSEIRMWRAESGTLRLWSIGPDRLDQHGELAYDPTNGVMSGGDIVVEMMQMETPAPTPPTR